METTKYLWSFYWDCGRQGSLEGLFVATEAEVEMAIGQEVYFGEVLGKHSEVYGKLEEGEITKMPVSPEAVGEVVKVLGTHWSGFNPLKYVQTYTTCEECKDTMSEDEWTVEYIDKYDKNLCLECLDELEEKDSEETN